MASSTKQHAESLRQAEIYDDLSRIKTQQLETDLEIEQSKLTQKQLKLDGEKIRESTQEQVNIALGYGLDKARIEADIAATSVQESAFKLGIASDNLLALEAQRRVNQEILINSHRLLEIKAHTLQSEVDQQSESTSQLLGILPSFEDLSLSMPKQIEGVRHEI